MGYETKCRARVDDHHGRVREADATVLIETDELIVRGEARVRVRRTSIQRVTMRGGVVTVTAPEATISLTLGAAAAAWQKRLEESPKRLIDKLDVKPGAKVWLLGNHDPTLVSQLAERTTQVVRGSRASACAVAFVAVESNDDLDRIDRALGAIEPAGAIWVVHRKGPTGVADTTIFGRARELGLTYIKVARVSDTHTAEKLVRPVASRASAAKATTKR